MINRFNDVGNNFNTLKEEVKKDSTPDGSGRPLLPQSYNNFVNMGGQQPY